MNSFRGMILAASGGLKLVTGTVVAFSCEPNDTFTISINGQSEGVVQDADHLNWAVLDTYLVACFFLLPGTGTAAVTVGLTFVHAAPNPVTEPCYSCAFLPHP